MTEKEQLQASIKDIDAEIEKLSKQKKDYEKQLLKLSKTFKEKFQVWYFGSSEGHHDWIPSGKEFPLVYELIDGGYYNRYQRYDLEHLVGEEILGLYTGDEYREFYESDEEYEADIKAHEPLMKEIMKNDLKSFVFDW